MFSGVYEFGWLLGTRKENSASKILLCGSATIGALLSTVILSGLFWTSNTICKGDHEMVVHNRRFLFVIALPMLAQLLLPSHRCE